MQVGTTTRLAFAVSLSSLPYDQYRHGLQKLEVDGTGTLRNAGLVGHNATTFWPLWQERSVQIGDQLYYLGNGALDTFSW
jgi:hypothetical protein